MTQAAINAGGIAMPASICHKATPDQGNDKKTPMYAP